MVLNYWLLLCTTLQFIQARKVVDLTHTFDKDAPKYPLVWLNYENFTYFQMDILAAQYFDEMWLAFNKIEYYEHQGTHIDAPNHFGNGRQALDEIQPERLIGPGVVIDIRNKVKNNPDYAVTVQDILDHEDEYDRIPPNAIVSFNSGWAQKYPNANLIFGTENTSDPTTFHFPGWSLEACKMLLEERQVSDDTDRPTIIILWQNPGDDVTGMMARSEKLVTTAEKLLGVEELYLFHGKCLLKEPIHGGSVLWHQDYGYWYHDTCLRPDMIAVFVAIDECTQENGGLMVLRGSHKCGRIDHQLHGPEAERVVHGPEAERVELLKKSYDLVHIDLNPGIQRHHCTKYAVILRNN